MRFTNATEVNDFMSTVENCTGSVWLEEIRARHQGDRFVLNSVFSRYVAMAALLTDKGEQLELFCQRPEDRERFFKYFGDHPGVN